MTKKAIGKSFTDGKFNYSAENSTNNSTDSNDTPEARANKVKKFFNLPDSDKSN